jgi:hypothetical protein
MGMNESIKSQYHASLAMLRQAIKKCPDSLWKDREYTNPFWRIAYHALFYTHLYLSPTENDFVPWEKHVEGINNLGRAVEEVRVYSKAEVLDYLGFCLEQVDSRVDMLDLEAESGFHWLPFNKLETQFYNIRHIMQHTGELCERLGAHGEIEVDWIKLG